MQALLLSQQAPGLPTAFSQSLMGLRGGLQGHLLAGLQLLVLGAALEVALAEGSVQHDGRLDGEQIPEKVQALQGEGAADMRDTVNRLVLENLCCPAGIGSFTQEQI